jgi:hypothetical protein
MGIVVLIVRIVVLQMMHAWDMGDIATLTPELVRMEVTDRVVLLVPSAPQEYVRIMFVHHVAMHFAIMERHVRRVLQIVMIVPLVF